MSDAAEYIVRIRVDASEALQKASSGFDDLSKKVVAAGSSAQKSLEKTRTGVSDLYNSVAKSQADLGASSSKVEQMFAELERNTTDLENSLDSLGSVSSDTGSEIASMGNKSAAAGADLATVGVIAGAVVVALAGTVVAVRSLYSFLLESAEASDRASAALDRIQDSGRGLQRVTGDALAPGLESIAAALERIAKNENVIKIFSGIGTAAGRVAYVVSDLIDNAAALDRVLRQLSANPLLHAFLKVSGVGTVMNIADQLSSLGTAPKEFAKYLGQYNGPEPELPDWLSGAAVPDIAATERAIKDQSDAIKAALAELDPYGAKIDKVGELQDALTLAMASGEVPVATLERALAALDVKIAELGPHTEKVVEDWMDFGDVVDSVSEKTRSNEGTYIDPLLDAQGHAMQKQDKLNELWNRGLDVVGAIGYALSGWDSALSKSIAKAAQLVDLMRQSYKDAQANPKGVNGSSIALGAGLGSLFAGGKTTSFGGRDSGTYSGELGAAGGSLPGMWGIYGAIIGTVVGAFIKKGADEGIAIMQGAAGEAGAKILESEHGLGTKAAGIIDGAVSFIQQLTDSTGARIGEFADISVKIRGKFVDVVVDGVKKRFRTLDEAMVFAVQEELKKSNISGLDPLVAAAVNQQASSTAELEQHVADAMSILRMELGDAALAMRQASLDADRLRQSVVDMKLPLADATKAFDAINANEISGWMDWRRSITGQQASPEELRKEAEQKAVIFNAEKQLRLAQIALMKIEVDAGIAKLRADTDVAKARLDLERQGLKADVAILDAKTTVTKKGAEAQLAILEAQAAALDQLYSALAAIPDIQIGEIHIGNFGKHVGAFGKSVDDFRDRWMEGIRAFKEAILGARTNPATTALTPKEQLQEQFKQFMDNLASAKGGNLTALSALPGLYTSLLEMAKTFSGGGTGLGFLGLGDTFGQFFSALEGIATGFVEGPTPSKIKEGNVVFDERLNRTAESQLREQRAHRDQAGQHARQLISVAQDTVRETADAARSLRKLAAGGGYSVGRAGG